MKKLFLLLFFNSASCIIHCAFSQNPLVKQWDHLFGGMDRDVVTCFQQTADGGYILGGYSISGAGGDKVQNTVGDFDYWIVKTDSFGNKQWDKDFGGTDDDRLYSLQQTTDGGYILGGFSKSRINGDKTQDNRDTSGNSYDYWIIKTDVSGTKQWDKDFGGTNEDELYSIRQTIDGGYILGGHSYSGISGDKTQALWGNSDYWIVKIDSLGTKQWDKDFGGTDGEKLRELLQTADSGYILGGYSSSGIGGDKTQPAWSAFSDDYWIVKIDSIGTKQWDKDFGGTSVDELFSIQQTNDKGYILGGFSISTISGDKTQDTIGGRDYWIVKTDSLGSKQWDKDFGGTADEWLYSLKQTRDGGYLLAGLSDSDSGGDKTENNLALEQSWIVKTDIFGNKQWDKTLLVNGKVYFGFAIQTKENCYAMVNANDAPAGGDKIQYSWANTFDYWLIKFCETLQAGFTSPSSICPGTCVDFTNLSLQATSYQWNFPGATPNTSTAANPTNICYANPGSYDVQLIATNTNGSDTLLLSNYITVYPAPAAQGISQSGDTLFANAGANSYQWYFNTTLISGATDYFYVAPASGDYNVVCTDSNGCEVEAAIFNVIAAAPPGLPEGEEITATPNPVNEKLEIKGAFFRGKKEIDISIYNLLGEKIFSAADCRLWTVDFSPPAYTTSK